LNPQPPDLESGALAVRATGPYHAIRHCALLLILPKRSLATEELARFAVNRMLATEAAVLLPLEPIWGRPFVLQGRIIALSTSVAH
jgi:hypothetical protein